MIKIVIRQSGDDITSLACTGHSGYANHGDDIVCSAVSTLVQNAILSLTEIAKIDFEYEIDEQRPYLSITLPLVHDHDAQVIMRSTVLGLRTLRKSYKKFINIEGEK